MSKVPSRIVIATLNINGLPRFRQDDKTKELLRPYPARHAKICEKLESSDIDVINFQEVFTERNRRFLKKHLPSYGYASFKSSMVGPKGGLITFSKLPMAITGFSSYFSASRGATAKGLSPYDLLKSSLVGGILVSRLTDYSSISIINTHLSAANPEWDWSNSNRFHSLQSAQLDALANVVTEEKASTGNLTILAGDLNVAKGSTLFTSFLSKSGMYDAFANDTKPTFHQDFLKTGLATSAIDVLLTSKINTVVHGSSERIFQDMPNVLGPDQIYLTDHVGLRSNMILPKPKQAAHLN